MSRVVLIGDWMIDRYWDVYQDGVSAETSIPRYRVRDIKEFPGGAGNVEANLRALRVEVLGLPGPVPSNPWAGLVYRAGTGAQNVKNRMILDGRQIMRWDENDVSPTIGNTKALRAVLAQVDAVVMADYGKGAIHPGIIDIVSNECALPVFVDTKRDPAAWSWTRLLFPRVVFFPNAKEYLEFKWHYDTCPRVVLKKGADGMDLLQYGVVKDHEKALTKNPVSVVGAGDTVIAAYVASTLLGRSPENALEDAARAAAVVVGKPYTATATWEEIWPPATRDRQ